ncbi:uncharacterized protein LOC142784586 [Rhipicephalus microplus]|uniref:uncharacterized protein LOC142784586 n=1 Tax=Rhipicephalus microplus TaxID=6941 RepID=UPI003F6ABB9E
MDVSTDTATLGPNADAVLEANKAASQPELGDEGGVTGILRPSSREAAKPSGEATSTLAGEEVLSATRLVVVELPRAEGEGATPINTAANSGTVMVVEQPPADAEVASQTDDELTKDVKSDKVAFNAEPDVPPPTRTFTFKVGSLA